MSLTSCLFFYGIFMLILSPYSVILYALFSFVVICLFIYLHFLICLANIRPIAKLKRITAASANKERVHIHTRTHTHTNTSTHTKRSAVCFVYKSFNVSYASFWCRCRWCRCWRVKRVCQPVIISFKAAKLTMHITHAHMHTHTHG